MSCARKTNKDIYAQYDEDEMIWRYVEVETNELIKTAFDKQIFNYADKFFRKRFIEPEIFEAIKIKQERRLKNPEYKDKYGFLTIYDGEINFLLDMVKLK